MYDLSFPLVERNENRVIKNLHINIYSSFICDKNLEPTLTSLNYEWINELRYIHAMENYSIKMNELLLYFTMCLNLSCILLSKRTHIRKVIIQIIVCFHLYGIMENIKL